MVSTVNANITSWSTIPQGLTLFPDRVRGVTFCDGLWAAVGGGLQETSSLAMSLDGQTWKSVLPLSSMGGYSVACSSVSQTTSATKSLDNDDNAVFDHIGLKPFNNNSNGFVEWTTQQTVHPSMAGSPCCRNSLRSARHAYQSCLSMSMIENKSANQSTDGKK
jgi:hypothetical protein